MDTLQSAKLNAQKLENRFSPKIQTNFDFNRKLVSFQANKSLPEYRWFKYKEGFSATLIKYIFSKLGVKSGKILDPFAGAGTTLFAAQEYGLDSLGIELLPVGWEIIQARQIATGFDSQNIAVHLSRWAEDRPWNKPIKPRRFQHLRITEGAFPRKTEETLEKFLTLAEKESNNLYNMLRFAALCVLEEISYTRKDGQYLRWDYRSRRKTNTDFDKGKIYSFDEAMCNKLNQICSDIKGDNLDLFSSLVPKKQKGKIELKRGSILEILPKLQNNSFDCLITSPPYCNRYDYTRTYALELALLGIGEEGIRKLRQTMLSCTVENREKSNLDKFFSNALLAKARKAFESQLFLSNVLAYLEECKQKHLLNNPGIVRMIKNYFWELTLCLFECKRILKPKAPFIMVNDNVRYQGITIPVDLILSDIARKAGFYIEKIWILPTGKGNSSQQMGNHGREVLRKCVYVWRTTKEKSTKTRDRLLAFQQ
ncbi:MAG: site-specific DNA-methyltransferase [Candidatus Omnitrophica bacterium]|nr:site-specific DNA-methyltransferase [Candidatus Omnitrophota bacterium]